MFVRSPLVPRTALVSDGSEYLPCLHRLDRDPFRSAEHWRFPDVEHGGCCARFGFGVEYDDGTPSPPLGSEPIAALGAVIASRSHGILGQKFAPGFGVGLVRVDLSE